MRLMLFHYVVSLILQYYGQGCKMLLTGQCICLLECDPSPGHELSYVCVHELHVEQNVFLSGGHHLTQAVHGNPYTHVFWVWCFALFCLMISIHIQFIFIRLGGFHDSD